jgi:predicted dehydrogenase/threonine dehydrogenase-like Zn-dependent dehydrogenase
MKQLLQNMRDGATRVEDTPVPQVRPAMALVRNTASLVSAGTERMLVEFAEKSLLGKARSRPDLVRQVLRKTRQEGVRPALMAALNRLDEPMPLGYSSAGQIVECGSGLQGFAVGDRVACAGSGYAVHAEYVVVPQNLLVKLPDNVDDESAAFTTLGAIALQGLRLAKPQLGERVAVIGMGLLGLLAAQMTRANGCAVFGIDTNPQRVELARRMGFQAVQRDKAVESGLGLYPSGFDCVLICADTKSNDPVELAGMLARERGHVVAVGAVGMDIPRRPYYDKEIQFTVSRSYGPGRYDPDYEERGQDYPIGQVRWTEGRNLEAFADLLASGAVDVKPLITHRVPISRGADAYDLITGKSNEPFLGVLLTYPDDAPLRRVIAQNARTAAAQITAGAPVIGVLGAGNYAKAVFLPAIRQTGRGRLKTIVSASGVHASAAARKYGFEQAASAEDAVLGDPEVNTLALLTRHNQHARQALAALSGGKHVYCEKPPALNEAELDQLEQALQMKNHPQFMAGYNRRFSPLGVELKNFLAGRVEPLWMHYRVNAGELPLTHWLHNPEEGGGRIIGEGCHFIDFLTFLTGSLPVAVSAVGLPDGARYRQDNVSITLEFADGSIGVVSYVANGDRALPKEYLELSFSGKSAALDDFRALHLYAGGNHRRINSPGGQDKGQKRAWAAFLDSMASGVPAIPWDEIAAVSRATFQAVRALTSREREAIA